MKVNREYPETGGKLFSLELLQAGVPQGPAAIPGPCLRLLRLFRICGARHVRRTERADEVAILHLLQILGIEPQTQCEMAFGTQVSAVPTVRLEVWIEAKPALDYHIVGLHLN